LKKALLQSAPWAAVALVVLALAWTPRFSLSAGKRRQLRAMSVIVVAMLALFAWAGLERHDGWSFNQRYLLELVPLFAVATALVVDDWELDASSAIVGGALGVALALVPIVSVVPEHWFRQRALMSLPLAIAAVTLVVWWASCRWRRYHAARTAVLSAAVGWALAVHLGDDVQAARGLRDWHGFQRRAVAEQLPAGASAVMAGVGQKEALCRLQLDHDLVLVDPTADGGKDTSRLTGELLAAGRRVFVVGGLPDEVLRSIFEGRRMSLRATAPIPLAEVFEAAARRPDTAPPKPEP
jgi:hypothetical protein